MTIDRARLSAIGLTLLAAVVMVIQAQDWVRIPVVLAFILCAPGLAFTRSIADVALIERVAMIGAVSISLVTAVTVALVRFNGWSTTSSFLVVGGVTLVGCLVPPRPLGRSRA